MRRLLARVAIPVLAALSLGLTSLPSASADPPAGESMNCSAPVEITWGVFATTCTQYAWWDYGLRWSHEGWLTVNNQAPYDVWARADLMTGELTYIGPTIRVAQGTQQVVTTGDIEQLRTWARGRGYLRIGDWSTYTYAP